MTVAYLVNQYPRVSHSFIRREIAALEAGGVTVLRFSIRPTGRANAAGKSNELVDPADRAELSRTRPVLDAGGGALLVATLHMMIIRPGRFAVALKQTLELARRGDAGLVRHLAYLVEACLLALWLGKAGATHLHAHFGTNSTTVAMLVNALTALPYSFTVHGPEEFDNPLALSLDQKIQHAAFVIAISSFGRSQLYRWCGHEHWPKIHVVHCGLDETFLNNKPDLSESSSEGPDGSNAPRFICVGRLCEQKGQLLLVEAAHRLVEAGRNFKLILVGDGDMRPDIEELIQRYHLDQVVAITGWQSGDQVIEHLRGARAMVLPSFAEGLPVAIMEALALGVPVISTYIAGIPELVTPECGWLAPAGSIDDLAQAMEKALETSSASLAAMGRAGAQRVHERHAIRIEADKLATLMSNLNESRNGA